jgi:NADH-quinone oxidoreductase subunit H
MTWGQLIWAIVKIAIMVGFVVNTAAILTWFDRRGGAAIQDRVGPNRAVIKVFGREIRLAGMLHPLADGLKFFTKEFFMPPKADKLLFRLAPILAMMPVLALVAVIPFGDTLCTHELWHAKADAFFGYVFPSVPRYGVCDIIRTPTGPVFPVDLMVAPLDVGVLYVFAMAGQGIVGAAIAGWASDNKFSLMGALRAASQMVSYEVAMGLSLIGAMMVYGTVRLDEMVRWQGEHTWGIFVQPLGFLLFYVAATAENKRIPFDLPEAESELVSGYFTEYSGMSFGMFYFAEYMEIITGAMISTTIFLGGYSLPFLHRDGLTIEFGSTVVYHVMMPHIWVTIFQVLTFFTKVLCMCWLHAMVRWTLPRFRYDQLMKLGWRVLLPLSLANVLVTGVVYLAIKQAGATFSDGLDVVAQTTQALIAFVITAGLLRLIVGFFKKRPKTPRIFGSSGKLAAETGGTPVSPMQA